MPHRFYCPHLVESGSVILEDAEAHHLTHVLRHQPEDIVELFSGAGLVAACRIAVIRKRDVEVNILASRRDPPVRLELTLATAVPKGDRFDWLIEKATELGVSRLVPITTSRSVVDPRDSKLDKLRQTVITACKQSGRNNLMPISSVTSWNDFLKEFSAEHRMLIAHPNGERLETVIQSFDNNSKQLVVAIGPEGGFSDEEVQSALSLGAKAVQLGPQILRIETAAIAVSARILF